MMQHSSQAPRTPPGIMVIFGSGGDLTKRKLIPALYYLLKDGLLSDHFAVIAVDHRERDDAVYREYIADAARPYMGAEPVPEHWQDLLQRIHYLQGDFEEGVTYERMSSLLQTLDNKYQSGGNCLFYLATAPRFFGTIAGHLQAAGLAVETGEQWRNIVVEKPFGTDLESARALNRTLHEAFKEDQIYRIDHYLGKETVQNILMYRFANSTVEPIWNRRYIDHVQITVAESIGMEKRGAYYDQAGALRDMLPSHMLALLSIVAMEPANSLDGNAVRDEQAKIIRAIQPILPEQVLTQTVRGQYGAGVMPDGQAAVAYRDEDRVDSGSMTETFIALKFMIDSWRWAGVPFYLRTGKRLPGRYTEIAIQFKHAPNMMFRDSLELRENVPPNTLILRIHPNEGIGMSFNAKVPSPVPQLSPVEMNFSYSDYFGSSPATGYETLIYDCMNGDATLFKRADVIEAGWALVQPVLDVWHALPPRDFPDYAAGTWGPPEADALLAREGRKWRPCASCIHTNEPE
ncbi:MAG: glucose-6-phosphate dehydrogenase [Gammaproteobacteria bacterium]